MKAFHTILVSFALLSIITLTYIELVGSTSQLQITTSGAISYVGPRLYLHTIYENGGVYYSANSDGSVEYQNSDASNVINWAIGASPNYANILLKDGTYTLRSTITDHGKDNILIEGQGYATHIVVPNTNMDGFSLASGTSGWTIQDLMIEGTKQTSSGSGFENAHFRFAGNVQNCMILNVYSKHANGYGVRAVWGTAPNRPFNITVLNCVFEDCGHNNICFSGTRNCTLKDSICTKTTGLTEEENVYIGASQSFDSRYNNVINCTIIGGECLINMVPYSGATVPMVSNNQIVNSTLTQNMVSDWHKMMQIIATSTIVSGNIFTDTTSVSDMDAIYIGSSGADDNVITYNNISGCDQPIAAVNSAILRTIVSYNNLYADTGGEDIYFPASVDYCVIAYNTYHLQIYAPGTHNDVHDNAKI